MIEYPKAKDFQRAKLIGTWGNSLIPIYDVPSMHSFNQLVGYVKHINAGNGTVLYRGQCKLYERVVPSIMHDMAKKADNDLRLVESISAIVADKPCLKFFGLRNSDVDGWRLYQKLMIEAILQHYGANTYCVDFVDNHWTALWFGLYEWDEKNNTYRIRNNTGKGENSPYIIKSDDMRKKPYPVEPKIESTMLDDNKIKELQEHAEHTTITFEELEQRNIKRVFEGKHRAWEREYKKVLEHNHDIDAIENTDHLFVFLYVADTNVPNLHGVYMGEKTYTIDLRKSLPSTFLRPCSQHGWVVRGKSEDYCFNNNISCVIRISVVLAREMLGLGTLLAQENFFPDETIDQGYNILLERQRGSRLKSKYEKLMPPGMITDFGLGK